MKRHGYRGRLAGVLFAVALGALAMLALPAIGVGKHGSDDRGPRPAGTIASFDRETHILTVDLAKGGEISALVVRRTHIRCGKDGRRHRRYRRARRGGEAPTPPRGSESVGDRAPDGARSGDEPGDGGGEEPGEDRGKPTSEPSEGNHVRGKGRPRGNRKHRRRCNAGDLVEGATVVRAEIVLTHGNAFFKRIGVLTPKAEDPEPEPEEEPEGE